MPAPSRRPIARRVSAAAAPTQKRCFCGNRPIAERTFGPEVGPVRASLIQLFAQKWVNGTVLRYAFIGGPASQRAAMRRGFDVWAAVGIGVTFKEMTALDDAEVRISFVTTGPDAGSWSYIGRDILTIPRPAATMNIGWNIANDIDTAVHEIGHTLGFPHEHQNPHAGIVWDEEAVYSSLAQPPNNWSREKTFHNIIRKIAPDTVQGSNWDPDSVMHYPFEAGLIREPAQYRDGLRPAGGLSQRDIQWVRTFYPPLARAAQPKLIPLKSQPLALAAGEQANFRIEPAISRTYTMQTFGSSDSVMVLFEENGEELRYLGGNDDSGTDKNASLQVLLEKGRRYLLRVRVLYAESLEDNAVMLW